MFFPVHLYYRSRTAGSMFLIYPFSWFTNNSVLWLLRVFTFRLSLFLVLVFCAVLLCKSYFRCLSLLKIVSLLRLNLCVNSRLLLCTVCLEFTDYQVILFVLSQLVDMGDALIFDYKVGVALSLSSISVQYLSQEDRDSRIERVNIMPLFKSFVATVIIWLCVVIYRLPVIFCLSPYLREFSE